MDAYKMEVLYTPEQNVQPIKDANATAVEVRVSDSDPQMLNSLFPNPFATEVRHFQVKNAADLIKSAAESELAARGFRSGPGGALVEITLRFFGATGTANQWTLHIEGRAILMERVQVLAPHGKVLYTREVADEEQFEPGYFHFGATSALTATLSGAMSRLFADPAFTAAILAARQPSPPAKPTLPGPIRRA